MAGQVYFGTADKQMWIKAPASGMKATPVSWGTQTTLLNGRAFVKRSKQSHREFGMNWVGSLNDSDLALSLQTIKDFADGIYGAGPYYWVDPYAVDQNILPPHWAAPMLAETDWLRLSSDIVPTFTSATVNNHFPTKYATYTTSGAYESTQKLTLIIPSGYKLAFGWHGPSGSSASGIRITPYLRSTGAADTNINPVMLTAGGSVRTNTNISGTTYSRVEIFLATDTATDVDITAMIAQIIPIAGSVASGGFISGKGTTGLEFNGSPTIEYYSSAINNGQIGMSASWIEV